MAEEETKTEGAEALENGTCAPDDAGEVVVREEVKEDNRVENMEEDSEKEVKISAENGLEKENSDTDEKVETEDVKMEEGGSKEEKVETEDMKMEEKESKEENEDEKVEENAGKDEEEGEKEEENKEEKDITEEIKEEKEPKKRRRGKHVEGTEVDEKKEYAEKKAKEPITPVAPSLDRPVRERKSVERLVASIEKEPSKPLLIGKGRGTALQDIPNVAYKLAKKKTDEIFIMLHSILFGRRGKPFVVKNNLSQFSGFAWHENEEKQKMRIKEKFDKCVKEKLLEFCDVLDIHVAKATTRKEDIVVKLIEFLEAPHATTNILLAEKEQSSSAKKRKRSVKSNVPKSGSTTAKRSARKRRKADDSSNANKNAVETEDLSQDEDNDKGNDITDKSEDEEGEHYESEEKDESEEETEKHKKASKTSSLKKETSKQGSSKKEVSKKEPSKKESSKKESSGTTKTKKISSPKKDTPVPSMKSVKPPSNPSKNDNINDTPKVFSRKKKTEEIAIVEKKSSVPSKSAKEKSGKEKTGKKVVKGKDKRKGDSGPTDDEIRSAVCEILKEVDFNTATFTDILKLLARHFDMDLASKKAAIKAVIQDELSKMAGEDEEDDEDEDERKDDSESDG